MNTKLKIFVIIEEAIDLFKSNYKLFLTISFLGAVCSLLISLGNQLVNTDDFINAVVLVLVVIFSIYFSFRLQIALIIAVNNRFQKFETDFQECYKTAGSYFWSYVFTSIALALLVGLSIVFIFFSISMEANPLVIALCSLLFGGLALLLLYYFNFAPLVSVLNPEASSNFSKSKELVKSQPRLVLSMVVLGVIVQILLYLSKDLLGGNSFVMNMEVSYVLEFMVDLVIAPLFTIVYMMVYYKLQETAYEQENLTDTATE
ncbi:hypothetical protein QYS49_30885 [Marivirga salinae]|uniref:Uncharacterized protein n=1 Tax=Marivirga salinarum TaxID=3059078 RepID=A0AA49JGS4_9BACT|nr:hypothetical protein [Marivirga sp. BDSF4-3]WKK75785.2 hypothetical protein QYS49_30885 [Marivirga sp. BDSF4-3]